MATYVVKTIEDRNLFITAAGFRLHATDRVYIFFKEPEVSPGEGRVVASVPLHNVFAVLDLDAFDGEFYNHPHFEDFDESAKETPSE